ncbi:MAG: DUF58 domain-containing protein [Myxococcaceae bacterium]
MARPARTFWQRLRWRLRPPRTLTVTPIGRTYLIITVGVGLGALNTGNNLLYLLLGLMLSMVVVSGVLSEKSLRGLRIRRIASEGAFAGERFAYRWAITREKGSAFALRIAEADVALEGEGSIAHLPSGKEHIVRADLFAPKRGPVALSGVKVTTTFPLGLFAKTRIFELPGTQLIFPRRGFTCALPVDSIEGPVGDKGNPRRKDGTGDLLGLIELQPGEDARRVHWLKSATAGKLLRTEREREERRSFVLRVEDGEGEALDRICEELAALSHRLLSQGHEVGIESDVHRLRPASGPGQERRILHALAWAGFDENDHVLEARRGEEA